jgi:hypothetical protein
MRHRILKNVLWVGWSLWALPSAWSCQLSCEVTYAGATQQVAVCPAHDPYLPESVNIGNRFRFKAIHINDGHLSPRIGIYVYLDAPEYPLLLQHVVRRPPYPVAPAGGSADLFGEQHLYAGPLERELIYRCAITPAKP